MLTSRLKHFLLNIAILSTITAISLGLGFTLLYRTGLAGQQLSLPPLADVSPDAPLTIVVRGWLWDPSSRRFTTPLVVFPRGVNEILNKDYALQATFHQFDWTRIPKDVFAANDEFTRYARMLGAKATRAGVCVNYVGHSGGAMMIYWAAARGVPMGYMGTLGLPTFGANKPPSVAVWANFYTDNHVDDIAGWMWGSQIGSDVNINLEIPHRDFWGSAEVHRASADGIARAWSACRPTKRDE